MELKNVDFVTRVLFVALPRHLEPYVRGKLSDRLDGKGLKPVDLGGRRGGPIEITDPAIQLKLLFLENGGEKVIVTPDGVEVSARRLLALRNRFAHPRGEVTISQAMETLQQAEQLFRLLGLDAGSAEISELMLEFQQHVVRTTAPARPGPPPRRPAVFPGARTPAAAPERTEAADGPAAAPEQQPPVDPDQGSADPGSHGEPENPGEPEDPGEPAAPDVTAGSAPAPVEDVTARTILDGLRIGIEIPGTISYAQAYNSRPPLRIGLVLDGALQEVPVLRVNVTLVMDGEPLTAGWDRVVTLRPGEQQRLDAMPVFNRTRLLDMDQVGTAHIRVEVSAGGASRVVDAEEAIRVLGPHNWTLDSDPTDLAAFVRPQEPATSRLALEASEILAARTGSSALNAYQGDEEDQPGRTDEIVDAVCRAVHGLGLSYSNPPASWGEGTQRIRSAEEVVRDRLATCLDTTVLLAGILEQIGIDAQLWLMKGHIFVGYWRRENRGGALGPHEPLAMANRVDLGEVGLVETTLLASAPTYPGLETLHSTLARTYLQSRRDEMLCVIDVAGARAIGVRPLPIRGRDENQEIIEVEYTQEARDLAALVKRHIPDTARRVRTDADVPERILRWKRDLLDLSLNNRLLRVSPRAVVDLAVPEAVLGAFEDMLHAGSDFVLEPDDRLAMYQRERGVPFATETDPPHLGKRVVENRRVTIALPEQAYPRELLKLARNARTIIEETGANNLYLALGTLVWSAQGKELRSPLVLVPVTLRAGARGTGYTLSLDDTGASTPNHSLLERLRVDHQLELPGLADPADDGAGIDLDATIASVRRTLAEAGLQFQVEPTVQLGLFDFAGFRLWKDLEDHWRSLMRNPLVDHLTNRPNEPFDDPAAGNEVRDLDELVAVLPTPSDAYQTAVVAKALAGHTFRVEGPPGTGKSQTITNLLVQAMIEGKKVLFVAEKQAALSVVARRLDAAGVGDLVLNLHDRGLRPTAIRGMVRRAMDLEATGDEDGLRMRTLALDVARRELNHYRMALHEPNGIGLSYYTSRTRELAVPQEFDAVEVPPEFARRATEAQLADIQLAVTTLADAARGVDRRPRAPWRALGHAVPPRAVDEVADLSSTLCDLVRRAPQAFQAVLRTAGRPEELQYLLDIVRDGALTVETLREIPSPQWEQAVRGVLTELTTFSRRGMPVLDVFEPGVLGAPLEQVRTEIRQARSALLGKDRRTRRALEPLARWHRPGIAGIDEARAEQLADDLIRTRDEVAALRRRLLGIPGFHHWHGADPLDPALPRHVEEAAAWMRARGLHRGSGIPSAFDEASRRLLSTPGYDGAVPLLEQAVTTWSRLETLLGGSLPASEGVHSTTPGPHIAGRGPLDLLETRLAQGSAAELTPSGLAAWSALERALVPFRDAGLEAIADGVLDGSTDPAGLPLALQRGLAIASRRERAENGRLRGFTASVHESTISRFNTLSDQVRVDMREVALSRIIAHRSTSVDRASRDAAGQLRRAVSGRSLPKIRTLFMRHGETLTRLMPCVLVSPDSAARFIPADLQLFDIVVFDEASQITTSTAIGAMGRGQSVVVVGDTKQMPPTRFAELTRGRDGGEEDDDQMESIADQESVLGECEVADVPRELLSWHYRSRSESLIAFSNGNYYDGRLASFPGPITEVADPGIDGHGVSMVRVQGEHLGSGAPKKLHRTNPVEADAIVQDVRARFAASPDSVPSIGVVTFNMPQRDLIESLLRETGDTRITQALDDREGVFVKNLENVQGDERDVILFSIAASPGANGEVPLNFGPLNRQGGERRLNVAVTRARVQVVVYCSFEPEQLPAERSNSVGVQHLRAYLELARHGAAALEASGAAAAVTDTHRSDIAEALRARGLRVQEALGLSGFKVDLALAAADRPDRPVVAVLLDGSEWARRRTEVDRDALPENVLRGAVGWPRVERVWMPDWLENRKDVVERLLAAVTEVGREIEAREAQEALDVRTSRDRGSPVGPAEHVTVERLDGAGGDNPLGIGATDAGTPLKTGGTEAMDSVPDDGGTGSVDAVTHHPVPDGVHVLPAPRAGTVASPASLGRPRETAGRSGEEDFVPWTASRSYPREILDQLASSRAASEHVRRLAREITEVEQPVQEERLARMIAGAHGLLRVRRVRVEEILEVVRRSRVHFDRDGFCWMDAANRKAHQGYRRGILHHLPIEEVHPREIAAAVSAVLARNAFAEENDVLRSALSELGGTTMTTRVRGPLERAWREVADGE